MNIKKTSILSSEASFQVLPHISCSVDTATNGKISDLFSNPQILSSSLTALVCYSLRAFRLLNHLVALVLVSDYYLLCLKTPTTILLYLFGAYMLYVTQYEKMDLTFDHTFEFQSFNNFLWKHSTLTKFSPHV